MILSCLPVSYFRQLIQGEMSVGQWADEAQSLGLDAIDLSILFFKDRSDNRLDRIREDIEAAGIHVALINTYPEFTHPDAQERKQQLAQLCADISDAARLGAKAVRVTSGQAYPETSRTAGIEWVIEGLLRAAKAAESVGVPLVYENHSRPVMWDYPDFNQASDIFLEIADSLRDTPIGLLFDTANPLVYGDDPLSLLESVIDQVVWVHAADTAVRGALKPVVIGTGIVPFDRIIARLHEAGFDSGISLEEASCQGQAGVAQAVAFFKEVWRRT